MIKNPIRIFDFPFNWFQKKGKKLHISVLGKGTECNMYVCDTGWYELAPVKDGAFLCHSPMQISQLS